MAGGDVGAVERVRVVQQIAELGERVATYTRDRRAAARVLGDEVRDHVAPEAVFEIQDVMRDPELVGHQLGVGDRIESFMVAPTTSYPSSTRIAAATELSTPPDMATRTLSAT